MKKILIHTALTALLVLGSCNSFLDVNPKSSVAERELFTTEQGFRDALTSCYVKMNSTYLYGLALTMRDIEWLAQHWSSLSSASGEEAGWKSFNYEQTTVKGRTQTIYLYLYNVIVQANSVLKNIEEAGEIITDQKMKAVIEGEALAIRAFCHFDALRLFGQVPTADATIDVSLPYAETVSINSEIPYYDFQSFVAKIFADIDKAEELLSQYEPLLDPVTESDEARIGFISTNDENDFYSYRRFRFNLFAVRALKARINLYIGNRQEANSIANDLIAILEGPGYNMELAGNNDFNSERYALPSECLMALGNSNISSTYTTYFTVSTNVKLWLSKSRLDSDLFPGETATNNRILKLWDKTATDYYGNNCPLFKKYKQWDNPDSKPTVTESLLHRQIVPIFRLSELYLIAIETDNNLSNASEMFKKYMTARSVDITTEFEDEDQRMETVIKEYRREFFGEGHMFYTYKRLNSKSMLWLKTVMEEVSYIVPKPAS